MRTELPGRIGFDDWTKSSPGDLWNSEVLGSDEMLVMQPRYSRTAVRWSPLAPGPQEWILVSRIRHVRRATAEAVSRCLERP